MFGLVLVLQVTAIDYSGEKTVVKTASGESYTTDKVLAALWVKNSACVV